MTLTELADLFNLELVVRRYPLNGWWHAELKNCELLEGSRLLLASYGDGSTPTAALNKFVERIRGKQMVRDASGPNRLEFGVPKTLYLT